MHGQQNIKKTQNLLLVTSGFRREAVENCALLGHYAARSGFLAPEDGADRLYRNVGNILPLFAALQT
jgi:hypothetical protein